MAGGDDKQAPPVIDIEPEKIPNYRAESERYSRLADVAREKATARTAERDEAASEYKTLRNQVRDDDRRNASNHEAVDILDAHVRTLEERDKAAGKESDELIRAREGLADQRQMAEASQHDYEAKLQRLIQAETKLTELNADVTKLNTAVDKYEDITDRYDLASRNATVAAVAIDGDPAATRRAVLEEVEHRADDVYAAQDIQRATFEELRRSETDVKTLKDEIKISQRMEKELETRVRAAEKADRGEEWASLQRELDRRHKQNLDLDERLTEATQKVETLTKRNESDTRELKNTREDVEALRKLADENPAEIQEQFTARMNGSADLASVTAMDEDLTSLSTELEAAAPATSDASDVSNTQSEDGSVATAEADPADSLDDLSVATAAGTDTETLAPDPGEGLDDVPDSSAVPATAPVEASAPAAPRIVDDEMLETPAAASATAAPAAAEAVQEPDVKVEAPVFDEPDVAPVAQEEPAAVEPEPEPEPELEPEPQPESEPESESAF